MLQPTFFMQNFLGVADQIKNGGAFYQPAGEGKAPYVDVRDIAAVATAALTESGHEGKTYNITGPQDLSCHDVAAAISRGIGKPVRYVDVPRTAAKESMMKGGMPEWQAEAVLELTDLLRAGKMSGVTNTVQEIAKKPPISIDQFVKDHRALFQ
jgi:uncharacterized protein YbjT (DUF2867 family)